MPFAYRVIPSGRAPAVREGARPLLVANLADPATAQDAARLATSLGADALLLSETEPADAPALGLEPAPLDRRRTVDLLVLNSGAAPTIPPPDMLAELAGLRLASVRAIAATGATGDYRRPERPERPGARRALFVFPGLFAPPRSGAHQRALSTVLDLIEAGYDVDLIVKGDGARFREAAPHLALLGARVESYVEDPAAAAPDARRRVADLVAKALGRARPQPGFFERERRDATGEGARLIAERLAGGGYDLAVLSFPWMAAALPQDRAGLPKIVCDAHDVVSSRTFALGGLPGAIAAFPPAVRRRERDLLARCDAVMAISETDRAEFEQRLGLKNVFVHPMTSYAAEPAEPWANLDGALRFGFIGGGMAANRQALVRVMTEWWPVVERFSPESTLTIAGAVGEAREVAKLVLLRENVRVLGPVDDTEAFWGGIDVLLAPASVRAGVNVKIVEALLRRRTVVTNGLGAAPLSPLTLPAVCEDAVGFRALLGRLDRREARLAAAVEGAFVQARALFGKPRPLGAIPPLRGGGA